MIDLANVARLAILFLVPPSNIWLSLGFEDDEPRVGETLQETGTKAGVEI